jgi:hypothetical protein
MSSAAGHRPHRAISNLNVWAVRPALAALTPPFRSSGAGRVATCRPAQASARPRSRSPTGRSSTRPPGARRKRSGMHLPAIRGCRESPCTPSATRCPVRPFAASLEADMDSVHAPALDPDLRQISVDTPLMWQRPSPFVEPVTLSMPVKPPPAQRRGARASDTPPGTTSTHDPWSDHAGGPPSQHFQHAGTLPLCATPSIRGFSRPPRRTASAASR